MHMILNCSIFVSCLRQLNVVVHVWYKIIFRTKKIQYDRDNCSFGTYLSFLVQYIAYLYNLNKGIWT